MQIQPKPYCYSTPQRSVQFAAKKPPVYEGPPPRKPRFDVEEAVRQMSLNKKKKHFAFHKVINFYRHPVDLTIFLVSLIGFVFPPFMPISFVLLMGRIVYRNIEAKYFTPEENLDAFFKHLWTGRRPNPFDY